MLRSGLVLLALPLLLTTPGCGPSSGPTRRSDPRRDAARSSFDRANETIIGFDGQTGLGNTPEAQQLARDLSRRLEAIRAVAFTGGRGPGAPSLTLGKFLTYCELRKATVCFLVHVPELRNYEDNARETLGRLAWKVARETVSSLPEDRRSRIGLGLRGILLYGVVMVGSSGEERPPASSDESTLYELFTGPLPDAPAPRAAAPPTPLPAPTPALSVAERLKRGIEAIGSQEFETRYAARQDLESLGQAAVPALVETAQDPKRPIEARATALHLLGKSGDARVIPLLMRHLEDDRVGHAAVEGLRYVKDSERSVLPQLARDVERRCTRPRPADQRRARYCFNAVFTLGRYGPAAAFAAPVVVRVIQGNPGLDGARLRTAAITTAGEIGPAAKDAVPSMIAGLGAPDTLTIQESIKGLSRMGPAAAVAIPALERVRQSDPGWARQVEEALTAIRGGTALAASPQDD
jgi:hypothetical protein